MQVQEIAAAVQAQAKALGIGKFDLSGGISERVSVQVDQGTPKQVKASQRAGITVRVWNTTQQVGIASTSDLTEKGLEAALQLAAEASDLGIREFAPDFSPEATASIETIPDSRTPLETVPTLVQTLCEAEAALLGAHEAIAGVPYNGLDQSLSERFYVNSEGANRYQASGGLSMYLYSKTEQPGRKPRSAGAYRLAHTLPELDIVGCWQEAAEKTASHLDYAPIATGKYPVVLSPDAFLSLLSAFSNLFNAQAILDRQSLSTPESLGSVLASSLLSVDDHELHPDNLSPSYFDGEGTPTRRLPLIAAGQLANFRHSAGTAKRMGAQPTGHADLGAKVTISGNFLHVFASQPELNPSYDVATAEGVIWIDDLHALHAGVSALEGSFSLPFDGWLLQGGERISIESATVAGDFRQLLQDIVYIEPTPEVLPGGVCPRIWLRELAVTGDAA